MENGVSVHLIIIIIIRLYIKINELHVDVKQHSINQSAPLLSTHLATPGLGIPHPSVVA